MNSYLKKGGIAIADQVLFSGSNFLLNLFLVKLLTPSEYGLFGSLYSLYLLIFVTFAAAFLEPYMFYKNKKKDSCEYTELYAGFSNALVVLSLLIFIIGVIVHGTIIVYSSYTIITCIIYFYKRHFFSIMQPIKSLYISVFYFSSMMIGLAILNFYPEKNIFNSFFVLYTVALFGILPTILYTHEFRVLIYSKRKILAFIDILKEQRKFSLHCIISSVLSWIPNNIYFILLPIFFSNELNAEFKALQNINLPLYHFNIAIVSMLIPVFMKAVDPIKIIKQVSILFIIFPLMYFIFILYFLREIEQYVYNDKYLLPPFLVGFLMLGLVLEILSNIYKAYFRSVERPETVTKINALNVVSSLFFIIMVYQFGLKGVVLAYVINNTFNLLSSLYFFNSFIKLKDKVVSVFASAE